MPIARITITSRNEPAVILKALREPSELFFKDIPDIVAFKDHSGLGIYEAKIRLRRFPTVVTDTIRFTVKQEGDRVVYESLEPGKLRAAFLVSEGAGITRVHAEISYGTPLKGSAVKNIFKKLIQNIDRIDRKEEELLEIQEEVKTAGALANIISCRTCLLYEANMGMCTYFMKKVEDPEKPICRGDKYIRASI